MKRTGVILGFDHLDAKSAEDIRGQIQRAFPNIAVAVINVACQPIAFEYNDGEGEQ